MKRVYSMTVMGMPLAIAAMASTALAGNGPHGPLARCQDPIPECMQVRLLDRFGDLGIDDVAGVLG